MIPVLVYYLVLPFVLGAGVLRLIKKYGTLPMPEDIARSIKEKSIEKKWFRVLRRDARGTTLVADCEFHDEAVDAAYRGKEQAQARKEKAAFLVLNDKGEVYREVDA